jgi:hypothetical protein
MDAPAARPRLAVLRSARRSLAGALSAAAGAGFDLEPSRRERCMIHAGTYGQEALRVEEAVILLQAARLPADEVTRRVIPGEAQRENKNVGFEVRCGWWRYGITQRGERQ